ncbi:GAF and ANTAR domain-containing protein [Pengzhenrongella frigida]|uniref:ANTAR domain-containing protein n=1 Tax=Pengzhenrongella frigida TaxID=1259133 RepID=A0A4Q5N5I3_9MICO|nr:GAF and ANTAR domain-containing protein [Cellulomonas sp. HLT2-17]RYV52783.1 ANTAR domain-containing protein [Cellulomonas sp. HLT2-17]
MGDSQVLNQQLAAAARSFQAESGKQELMEKGFSIATEIIDGCQLACVSILHRGDVIDTPAATNEKLRVLDELQFTLNEGPCFDALWSGETVLSPDLAKDSRWPRWGPGVVAELGVASMLCYRLFTTGETIGALNLYSRSLDAFDADDISTGYYLAAHLAVAIAEAKTAEQLHTAIGTRTAIGQAEGILMERFNLQPAQAFAVLTRISQDSNVRLHLVAAELVRTRTLPVLAGDQPAHQRSRQARH